jgi:hypothetical protein
MKSFRHAGRPRRAATGAALLLAAALGAALGPWAASTASAKTITATCAGNSTDAATLNAAISGSSAGDQIMISGSCLLTAPVTLIGDRSYEGGSRTGTVLQQAAGANLPYLLASDTYVGNDSYTGDPFTIHQLTIDCNGSHNTAATNGLVLHSWQTTAEDLQIENCGGSGIVVASATPNGTTLTKTQVNGVIQDNYITGSGTSGVYVQDGGNVVTDWHLDDNYIAGSGQDAIHLQNAAGWYIDGNHLYGNGGDAIYANRIFATSIQNNYIEDFGGNGGSTTWYGISATAQGGPSSTISGNRVFMFPAEKSGTSYRYIAVTQVNYGTGAVTLTGNSIVGAGSSADTGFYFNAGSGVTLNVTSAGNAVASVGTARATGTGVTLSAGI